MSGWAIFWLIVWTYFVYCWGKFVGTGRHYHHGWVDGYNSGIQELEDGKKSRE